MNRLFPIITALLILQSCGCNHSANEYNTMQWLKQAKRPIVCRNIGYNNVGYHIYEIKAADSAEYLTGYVSFNLKDTIK